jgi:hypothetical protein
MQTFNDSVMIGFQHVVICVVHLLSEGVPVFVLASSSGLRGHKRTYLTILESADRALFKMVRYVLLRPLRPELDAQTKTCLPAKTSFCHLDEQANCILTLHSDSVFLLITKKKLTKLMVKKKYFTDVCLPNQPSLFSSYLPAQQPFKTKFNDMSR